MKRITLTNKQYEILMSELFRLELCQENEDGTPLDKSKSESLEFIENNTEDIPDVVNPSRVQ